VLQVSCTGLILTVAVSGIQAQVDQDSAGSTFRQLNRPGSVDLAQEYNLKNLQIPQEQIHTLLPRDAIPALTNPKLEPAQSADWLPDNARIIAVSVDGQTVGVPLRILDWHEIVNMTIGREPIAATYCPLCDSATVFSRRIRPDGGGEAIVLEFGVSGALYNSNVLIYDRRNKGLWSQLRMRAVSGPLAGNSLDILPVEVVSFKEFKKSHRSASIVGRDTGHERDYSRSPYERYFKDDQLMVPVMGVKDALPRKTLGVGIAVGALDSLRKWFVPADTIADGQTIETPAGKVRLARTDAGIAVTEAPGGVRTAQTFYYAWSTFYPNTEVIGSNHSTSTATEANPGLAFGTRVPKASVTGVDGQTVQLDSLYRNGLIVITFYRGGWCPICNRTLAAWAGKLQALNSVGGTLIAKTPERTDLAVQTRANSKPDYQVYQ